MKKNEDISGIVGITVIEVEEGTQIGYVTAVHLFQGETGAEV